MKNIKTLIKIFIGLAYKSYCLMFQTLKGKNIILMYHRVRDDSDHAPLYDSAMYISRHILQNNIKEISKYFEIINIDDINESRLSSKPTCILTFDDGWADNYNYALPVLVEANVPATIFLTADYIGKNKSFWFHDIWLIALSCLEKKLSSEFFAYFNKHVPYQESSTITENNVAKLISCLKVLPSDKIESIVHAAYSDLSITRSNIPTMLNWQQILEMNNRGISFGSHGMNHYILTNIDNVNKTTEIADSLSILKEKLPSVSRYFCYPNGNYDEDTIRIVKQVGYRGAIGTEIGFNTEYTDDYRLHRIALHDDIASSVGLLWYRIFQCAC